MAKYDSIHGTTVRNYTSDPDTLITGQVWYDKTAGTLQYQSSSPAGSWSTGGNMNTARQQTGSSAFGTQSASVVFAGYTSTAVANNESYNGSSWTEVGDVNTARRLLVSPEVSLQKLMKYDKQKLQDLLRNKSVNNVEVEELNN